MSQQMTSNSDRAKQVKDGVTKQFVSVQAKRESALRTQHVARCHH